MYIQYFPFMFMCAHELLKRLLSHSAQSGGLNFQFRYMRVCKISKHKTQSVMQFLYLFSVIKRSMKLNSRWQDKISNIAKGSNCSFPLQIIPELRLECNQLAKECGINAQREGSKTIRNHLILLVHYTPSVRRTSHIPQRRDPADQKGT